ncbi:MAG: 3-oxoacyl-ACP reductase FabG [Spirochaetota bacterium]|jgi:3-oxoacyl-[acyl-carrier protein] reductase|nr:3-oxoacyl-ACP reductase FabG [Spirochaetota bacterium]
MNGIALVTGASRGIGAAIARALARDGFDIWLNYRSSDSEAEKVKKDIETSGRECALLKFDVADYEAAKSVLAPLVSAGKVPYAVINNAGFRKDNLLVWLSTEEWKSVINVNLDGFFNVTKQVLPFMLNKRRGRIINIASTAAHSGMAGLVNYSAAKAGLVGATRALALETAKRNILVNVISPGFIETDILDGLPMAEIIKTIPLGKTGKPEDVAELASFLCSDKAAYITGQAIQINGGLC